MGILIVGTLLMVVVDPNMLPEVHVKCLKDTLFGWTESINKYFITHSTAKKVIIAVLAGMMDLLLLTQLGLWCTTGKSWRLPIAITLNYLLRFFLSVSSNTFSMSFIEPL